MSRENLTENSIGEPPEDWRVLWCPRCLWSVIATPEDDPEPSDFEWASRDHWAEHRAQDDVDANAR